MPVITCCNRELNIPYTDNTTDTGSLYIKDLVELSGSEDVIIPVPDKYCTVIDNYVEFVLGNQVPITSRERLLLCFHLNTLLIDESYFKYCIQQVFNNWSYMCNMVYNEFNDDLQWSFFVYCPHDFIPKHLLDNNTFMKQWNNNNQGTIINVNNDNEVYYNNVEKFNEHNQKCITTLHTVKIILNNNHDMNDVKVVGNKREIIYYANSNNIMSDISYVDGKIDGFERWWYDNDQHTLEFEKHYVDGKLNGVWRYWYDNDQQTTGIPQGESLRHTLRSEGQYVNGEIDGVWRRWYDDDQHTLSFEGHYVDGKESGVSRTWYDNDQHTLASEQHYIDGKLNGVWREWYNDDQQTTGIPQGESLRHIEDGLRHIEGIPQGEGLRCACRHTLMSEENYVNDNPDGVWRSWYNNKQHTLESEKHYVNGKLDGVWRYWYDNDQQTTGIHQGESLRHTLESEKHYVNGKLNGVWRSWYDNDQHTLKSEEHYINGKSVGHRLEFDLNGDVIFDDEYTRY